MDNPPDLVKDDKNLSPEEVQKAFASAEKKAAEVQEAYSQAAQYAELPAK